MTDGTVSSGRDPLLHPGLVWLSQKATPSVQMRSADTEKVSTRLECDVKRSLLSLSRKIAVARNMDLMSEMDDLVLQWNDYKMSYTKV